MTAVIESAPNLTGLDDAALAELFASGDEATQAAILAEMQRQDDAAERERKRRAWRTSAAGQAYAARDAAWYEAAHQEYLQAEAATRGRMLAPGGPDRDAFPLLWQCSERQFDRWASEEMRRWRQFDAQSFTRKRDFMRDASRPRAGEYPWHEPPEETMEVQTVPPAPAAAAEETAEEQEEREEQERWAARDARIAERAARVAERAAWAAERRAAVVPPAASPGAAVAVPVTGQVIPPGLARRPAVPDIDGALLLDYVAAYLARYVWWPSVAARDAVVLWIAHALARNDRGELIWRCTPRLLVTAATRGAGKSTVMDLMVFLALSRFGRMGKVTPRALEQVLGSFHEPAFLDEAQRVFGAGRRSEDIQASIAAGYTRRAGAVTTIGSKTVVTSTFGPVALAGIDSLITSTGGQVQDIIDRCVIVRLYPQPDDVRMPEVNERAEDHGELLGKTLAAWLAQAGPAMAAAATRLADEAAAGIGDVPDIGDGGRHAQCWRPLVAVADTAGGRWPGAARDACAQLVFSAGPSSQDEGAGAMAELAGIFGGER